MTPEQKLAALFAADVPPSRDYAFQADVARRVAARRAWLTVLALVPWAVAAAALLWALGPVLEPLSEGLAAVLGPATVLLVIAALAGGAGVWLSRRVLRRFSGA